MRLLAACPASMHASSVACSHGATTVTRCQNGPDVGGQNAGRHWIARAALGRRPAARTPLLSAQAAAVNGAGAAASRHAGGSDGSGLNGSANGSANGGSWQLRESTEAAYLAGRSQVVCRHFPQALGIDDFVHRMEIALFAYGFTGDNSIAMVNLCRDEVTNTLKHKLDSVFGSAFNTNGLGGVLTCGVTGVSAGLSHAPISRTSGKERYVFFSFPHISIDATGAVGAISRPGRPGTSCACGALNAALAHIKSGGLAANCKIPGVHEPLDPEYTILKQRLARRLRYEGASDDTVVGLSLVDITSVAERTITDDLEDLIARTVDPGKADYAVVTGVQIHNWGRAFDDASPNLEFVAPTSVYAVVNGEKTYLDLQAIPSPTPRQIKLLAAQSQGGPGSAASGSRAPDDSLVCNYAGSSTMLESEPPYLYSSKDSRQGEREASFSDLLASEGLQPELVCAWPSWQSILRAEEPHRDERDTSVVIDQSFESDKELDDMWDRLQDRYLITGRQESRESRDSATGAWEATPGSEEQAAAARQPGNAPDSSSSSHSPSPASRDVPPPSSASGGSGVSNSPSPSSLGLDTSPASATKLNGTHAKGSSSSLGGSGSSGGAASEPAFSHSRGLLNRLLRGFRSAKDRH